MIKYLHHEEIDYKKWDDAISRSFNGMVYAYSWYLDVVSPGWEALINGDYKSVMPLTAKKKFGFSYLFQPFFTQQLGVFSSEKSDAKTVHDFIESIPEKFKLIEINLNIFNQFDNSGNGITHELDLISTYENIEKNYSQNLKRNLKKAKENQLVISHQSTIESIIDLFRNNRGKEISKLKNEQYQMLTRLFHKAFERGKAMAVCVSDSQNELCAGAVFVESNNKMIFLFSGINEKGKQLHAMPFLIDSVIQKNAGKNITLDFEGSMDLNLARFYKSFGSKECLFPTLRSNNLPFPINIFK